MLHVDDDVDVSIFVGFGVKAGAGARNFVPQLLKDSVIVFNGPLKALGLQERKTVGTRGNVLSLKLINIQSVYSKV